MQQRCRTNFCPARIAEEKVFLLKLFNLAFHFFSSHWINEEIPLMNFSAQRQNFFSSADFCCDAKFLFDQTMQERCRNNLCPARIAEEKVFLLKLFNLCLKLFSTSWINEENFSLESLSTESNFFSSANFYCDTFGLYDQTMQERCRNNLCPARIAEEKVFLLKLLNLCLKLFSSRWNNEENFSLELLSTEPKFLQLR